MKYVLVTGAGGGMGKAAVSALSKAGYFVFALDKKECEGGAGVLPLQTDITDGESVAAAFEKVKEKTDTLHAILHFAGIYLLDSLVEISEEQFLRAFEVNLFGVYRINKIFLPLVKQGGRVLITTSELAPLSPLPFTGLYAVTKGALDKYAHSLRMELQLLGVSVSVLRPGAVKTDMLGVSTAALDKFCENTKLYQCNAKRFKRIVEGVEAKNISPEKVAKKALKIIKSKRPKPVYAINRNPLLLLLNALPVRFQNWVIKRILK